MDFITVIQQVIIVFEVLIAHSAVVVLAALNIVLDETGRHCEVELAGVAYMMPAGVGFVSVERAF